MKVEIWAKDFLKSGEPTVVYPDAGPLRHSGELIRVSYMINGETFTDSYSIYNIFRIRESVPNTKKD